jgi:hypothetical protein
MKPSTNQHRWKSSIMNSKPNQMSNLTRAKSLVSAVTIAIGLQGVLLWQVNEVASAGAQSAMLAAPAPGPAQTSLAPPYRFALQPVTIVARRESKISELKVASTGEPDASSVVDGAANTMLGGQKPVFLN